MRMEIGKGRFVAFEVDLALREELAQAVVSVSDASSLARELAPGSELMEAVSEQEIAAAAVVAVAAAAVAAVAVAAAIAAGMAVAISIATVATVAEVEMASAMARETVHLPLSSVLLSSSLLLPLLDSVSRQVEHQASRGFSAWVVAALHHWEDRIVEQGEMQRWWWG